MSVSVFDALGNYGRYGVVHYWQAVSDLILNGKRNFLTKFVNNCDNVVCGAISIMAKRELDCLK